MSGEFQQGSSQDNLPESFGSTRIDRQLPMQSVNWTEALYNTSWHDLTKSASGKVRFPGGILPGLTRDIIENDPAIERFPLYVLSVSSLYHEHKDGQIDDETARTNARQIFQFFNGTDVSYDKYFREGAKRERKTFPEDLDEILKDPKKLLEKYK